MPYEAYIPYLGLGCFVLLFITFICYRCRRLLGALFSSAIGGWLALTTVNLTGAITGITLGVNIFSIGISTLLGIPGVISILLLQIFW